MKRYIVFAFMEDSPAGGIDDIKDMFETIPLAVEYIKQLNDDVVQLFDSFTGKSIDVSLYVLDRNKHGEIKKITYDSVRQAVDEVFAKNFKWKFNPEK